MSDLEQRPSPEALLAEANRESRGKLKIFMGAAPGVGKTYAMLSAARSRIAEGVDTVIGIVETHRRSETEALTEGIEQIPRQQHAYRGLSFEEMNLDGILQRKPKLVLVDELAHTNVPGARHPKRYQDVQEILDGGIDVYSTLNVQHIESLNDIVARITGVTVRETVPDTVVQGANSIELIDLPPDELLQRLKEGKVYIPEQARLAINRFFTPGNLTALRELALRQAAARVDEDMTSYMRRHAIAGPWPTSNRVMVCIADDRQATALVRSGRRSAERRQAPWLALYIQTSRHEYLPEASREEIAQAMNLAETMGGETMTVIGEDPVIEILRVARERNVSTILIGKSVRSFWSRLARPSVAARLLETGEGFDITLLGNREQRKAAQEARRAAVKRIDTPKTDWSLYAKTTGFVAVSALAAGLAGRFVPIAYAPYFYVMAVLLAALDYGTACGLYAMGLSLVVLMAADAFMPHVALQQGGDWLSFVVLAILSSLIAVGGGSLNMQIRATRRNAERTQLLYDFTKSLTAAASIDDVAAITVRRVAMSLGVHAALLMPKGDRLEPIASVPAEIEIDTASNAAIDWAWLHNQPAGYQSNTLPNAPFYVLPLQSGSASVGILAVRFQDDVVPTLEQRQFLASLASQVATAVERAQLVANAAQSRLVAETDKLRTNLLSSISYDLREPLDRIRETADDLALHWNEVSESRKHDHILAVQREASRLDRFVQNFLDMTRLVTGNVQLNLAPVAVRGLVDASVADLSRMILDRPVYIDVAADIAAIYGDAEVLRRVLDNVIANACLYSPEEGSITISARQVSSTIIINVADQGNGIPENERNRVFDMFYRIKNPTGESRVGGTGLGLSISRGYVEAHQGRIYAETNEGGHGARIVIVLPAVV